MARRTLIISKEDHQELSTRIIEAQKSHEESAVYLQALRHELERAKIVEADKVPANVVRLGSEVELKFVDNAMKMTCTLVLPEYADSDNDMISIFAPMATALIGYREGDEIEFDVRGNIRKIQVVSVKQPTPKEA